MEGCLQTPNPRARSASVGYLHTTCSSCGCTRNCGCDSVVSRAAPICGRVGTSERRCGSSASLGSLLRAKKNACSRAIDQHGQREPQVATEWRGESVRQAKELDMWVGRVREMGEQAHRADARLGEALREARDLRTEFRLSKEDVARLRSEAENALRERVRWEGQLEVSKSCIQKLESRLLALRRCAVEQNFDSEQQHVSEATRRAERELQELVQQRDRLRREKATLERLSVEHDREVRILTRALKTASPFSADQTGGIGDVHIADAIETDLQLAAEEAEVMRLQVEAADLKVEELRRNAQFTSAELATTRGERTEMASRLRLLEGEADEHRAADMELSFQSKAAKNEELAVREEINAVRFECEEEDRELQEQQALRAFVTTEVQDLEASVEAAWQRLQSTQAEGRARVSNIEAQGDILRSELAAQESAHSRDTARQVARKAENAELEDYVGRLECELEAGEAARSHLVEQLSLVRARVAKRGAELRAEEAEGHELVAQTATAKRREEVLRSELADERFRAQESSRVAAALLDQRRRTASEAEEALRLCNGAVGESWASEREVRLRDEQIAKSQRSCELMQRTLGQRLDSVHAQVKEAEQARATAALELREERLDHQRLRALLLSENVRRRARILRTPPPPPSLGSPFADAPSFGSDQLTTWTPPQQ